MKMIKKAKTFTSDRVKKENVIHSICIPKKLWQQLEELAVKKNISKNALINLAVLTFLEDTELVQSLENKTTAELRQLLALNFHEKVGYLK